MRNFQAHGHFLKRGVHFYRTAAHLQWGHSAISLGCCLLLNPGSATLEKTAPDLYKQLLVNGEAHGQVTPDPTMDQLAAFLEGVYSQAIEGRFTIYNLFWLQNTDDQDAIEQFVSMVEQKVFEFDESLVDIDELQQHPWILIGWGVKKHKRHWIPLVQIKERWTSLIRTSIVPYFGKPHPKQQSGYYYYHPCPQILNLRPLIIDDLQKLFNRNIQHLLNK